MHSIPDDPDKRSYNLAFEKIRQRLGFAVKTKVHEGIVEIGDKSLGFQSLLTSEYNSHEPLVFIRHNVGVITVRTPEILPVSVHPKNDGAELFWLRRIHIEPLQ